jgi:uncharacterized protein YjbI with pentapeptide repeats
MQNVGCHNITTSAKKYFSKKFIDLKTTADKDYVLQRLRLKWLRPTKATFEMATFEKATFEMTPFEMTPFEMATFEMATFEMATFEKATFEKDNYYLLRIKTKMIEKF